MGIVRLFTLLLFVLLITQSIFGSPFKQDNHVERSPGSSSKHTEIQGRQGSSTISTRKEGDEKNKRKGNCISSDAGAVISGAQLGLGILTTILNTLGSISRKVAIGVDNESGYKWRAINIYFYSGTSNRVLPHDVSSGTALLYGARKTAGPVARGAVGVLTYYIPHIDKTLAVMYSVPFDYNWYSNWFDVWLYSGKRRANYNLWYRMYYDNPFKGDNYWHERDLGSGLRARGAMSNSGQATIEIHILKQ
ncbi:unnamed protein product [Porites evermanni]|uniref:Actinoporin n=1 Tax=Porites evermanni TaxID=104178 RepID=A0ABN8LD44_9CNID|nr:unnamed protein product [Porites evermanni]